MSRTARDARVDGGGTELTALAAAEDSFSVAAWTLVSRLTGVLRVAAVGAVLGPTLLGNTFQFANSLPNLVYYGFLAGSMSSSLLVPALVRPLDAGDRGTSERVAGGFLGVALLALAAAGAVAALLGPLALRVGSLGSGLGADAAAQEQVARWLLLMVMPQVMLYAVVGCSTASMNACRRFALGAAAPALENLGILAVLGATAWVYGTQVTLADVPPGEVVLLGVGATAAVGLHAATQWWGAHRAGITLRPRAGWRDPEVTELVRRSVPAMGVAGLAALQLLTLLALANRVPGGVVALQMGLTFYFVVIALVAAPVALSLLPTLARLHHQGEDASFHDVVGQGLRFAIFLTVPAAVGLLAISEPLAHLMALGRMGSEEGTALVAFSIAALAPGIIGEAVFLIATYASYARDNSRTPLESMLLQVGTFGVLVGATLLLPSVPVTASLALAFSVSSIVGAAHLARRLSAGHAGTGPRLSSSARRVGLGGLAMAGPVWLVAQVVPAAVGGRLGAAIAVVAATTLGAVVYLSLQALWRAPELAWLGAGLSRLRTRGDARARAPHGGAR